MSDLSRRIAVLSPEKLKLLAQRLNSKKNDVFSRTAIIPQSRECNTFPLSFAQQRLWFLDQLQPGNIAYNIFQGLRLIGRLNIPALQQSFNEVVQRHEALRTTFTAVDGQPIQVISPSLTLNIPVIDWRSLPPEQWEAELLQLANAEAQRPFDLAKDPLLRVTIVRLAETEQALFLIMHHIISDAWSLNLLIEEIVTLYTAFDAQQPSPLPKLPIQYADYAVWEQNYLQGEVLQTLLNYWRRQLGGQLPTPKLPTKQPHFQVQTYKGATYKFDLPLNLYPALQKLSQQTNTTLFMTLLAGLATLLHRYTGQDDIIIGSNISNRNQVETQGLIGFFVNILLLRTNLSDNPIFWNLLEQVREITLGAYDHQNLPFAKLVEVLQPERNLSQAPMFEVLFVMEHASLRKNRQLPGLTVSPLKNNHENAKFDLALFIVETEDGLVDNYWHYNAELFDASAIARMTEHFATLLQSIVAQPDARINNLEMLTAAEKEQQIMAEIKQEQGKLKKFMKVKPKAVKLPQGDLIKTDYLQPEQTLPLVIQPQIPDIDIIDWAKSNRDLINTKLQKHGAILFRNFNIDSIKKFENLAQAICPELFSEYGDLPREEVGGKVYGSTPYPADQAILFHNESSHMHCWPMKIWFYCVQPAQQGGETPIVDCRKAYQLLSSQLREKLQQKQFMYIRNYIEGLDVSWQQFFHTDDKSVVEEYCDKAGMEFEWLINNNLQTRKLRSAIVTHPQTHEPIFFNQIQLHHISYLDSKVRESLLSLFGEKNLPRNVYYGDGSPIEDAVIVEINEVYQQVTISFPWEQNDVLMLENMLTAHGRNPYVGPRKIVVAMGEMIHSENI
ncbi:hypothetical protein FM036_08780 [Nostoc sp. HG1]|nr:hypothetical protein [Nostoc sp. HG1]